ncbi:MAG: hypothetical protein ACQCN6_03485 [Candidatus Bathyarchaeia archaeon]
MSSPLTNDQIRLAVLELLHEYAQKDHKGLGVENREIAKSIGITENLMDFNLTYLRQKGLIEFVESCKDCYWIEITAFGCDVVEHKNRFVRQFPFINVTIQNQNIQGNSYGAIQAGDNAKIIINQQQAFQQAYSQIENSELEKEQKDFLQTQIKGLEQEIKKGADADVNGIKKAWMNIKENASWLIPTLTNVVTEGVKIACGVS